MSDSDGDDSAPTTKKEKKVSRDKNQKKEPATRTRKKRDTGPVLVEAEDLPDWVRDRLILGRNDAAPVTTNDDQKDTHIPEFTMDPSTFEVVLLVDIMEVAGGRKQTSKEKTLAELKKRNVCLRALRLSFHVAGSHSCFRSRLRRGTWCWATLLGWRGSGILTSGWSPGS